MTIAPESIVISPEHKGALARLKTIRQRVAYACEHAPAPYTDVVRAWLSAHGAETKNRTYVSSLVTGYRSFHGLPADTGSIPAMTPDRLAAMDGQTLAAGPADFVEDPAAGWEEPGPPVSDDHDFLSDPTLLRGAQQRPDTDPVRPRTGRNTLVLVLVLVLVNSAAIWGQASWALEHIVPAMWPVAAALALSLGFAAALELIGVFLARSADDGEAAGLPSGGIRLGSYAVGLISGGLNFSHWLAAGTAAAITFGFLSAVSPFLWSIWSRVRRGRAVAPSRRFWHPVRSVGLIRHMAWHGIVDEAEAIAQLPAK